MNNTKSKNIKFFTSDKIPKCSYINCISNNLKRVKNTTESLKKNEEMDGLFKSCHYCYTFYCSRDCRRLDWPMHKNYKCLYGRFSSYCKKILIKVGRNRELRIELSKIAYNSYLNTMEQRGFLWLDFTSVNEAQMFLDKPINLLDTSNFLFYFADNLLPKYVTFTPIDDQKMNESASFLTNNDDLDENDDFHVNIALSQNDIVMSQLFLNYFQNFKKNWTSNDSKDDEFESFNDLCKSYNPEKEFILLVSIKLNSQDKFSSTNSIALPRKYSHSNKNSMYVLKFIKVPLVLSNKSNAKTGMPNISNEMNKKDDLPLTLILTSMKDSTSKFKNSLETSNTILSREEDRQLFLANLLNEFEMRGINLRQTYPKIYMDLCSYVDENKPFSPICLFPRDLNKNNLFMCMIMPNSEPSFYDWLYESNELVNTDYDIKKIRNQPEESSTKSPDMSQYLCIL